MYKKRFFLICTVLVLFLSCKDNKRDNGITELSQESIQTDEVEDAIEEDGSEEETVQIPGFVYINGGTFLMGTHASEPTRERETQHQVTVSSFYMGVCEVTQEEYEAIMGRNPSTIKVNNHPVVNVTWLNAVEFCNRLSLRDGLSPVYTIDGKEAIWDRDASGYRLPTEAEWEYACRAGTTTRYWSGNDETSLAGNANVADWAIREVYPGYSSIVDIYDGYALTSPVASFAPNPWGLYDMHGNVNEWCWDLWEQYTSASQIDPIGASSGYLHIFRGGSCFGDAEAVRSADRVYNTSTFPSDHIGFRIAKSK